MKVPAFLILLGVTVAITVAAALVATSRPTVATSVPPGEPFLDGFADTAADVRRIEVTDADGTLAIAAADDGWVLPDHGGFPAEVSSVRTLLVALTELERLEAKTDNPDLFPRLDLAMPDAEDGPARRVVLKDGDGAVLLDLLVGKAEFAVAAGEPGRYVRHADGGRAWLVVGQLNALAGVGDWVDREIMDLPPDRVARLRIDPPEGPPVILARPEPGADLALDADALGEDLPEGEPRRADIDSMARVLEGLRLESVQAADDVPAGGPARRVLLETTDGAVIEVRVVDGEASAEGFEPPAWLTFTVAPPDGEAANDGGPDYAGLAERVEGWAYRIPAFAVRPWRKELIDLVEAPGETATGGAGSSSLPQSIPGQLPFADE